MKTDLEHKIDAIKKSDSGKVLTQDELQHTHKEIYCCGQLRTPQYELQFPNDDSSYFVCPECMSY